MEGLKPEIKSTSGFGCCPGKTREIFHTATLTLGTQRIKDQETPARATHPAQKNQIITEQHDINRTQTVFAGTF